MTPEPRTARLKQASEYLREQLIRSLDFLETPFVTCSRTWLWGFLVSGCAIISVRFCKSANKAYVLAKPRALTPSAPLLVPWGLSGFFFFEESEMQELMIAGLNIRRDAQGRYCFNDLHRASGGENRHRPQFWLANQQTLDLIKVLDTENSIAGIPAIEVKQQLGTFGCIDLVYAYAMWLDASFYLKVIRAYRGLVNDELLELRPKAQAFHLLSDMAGTFCLSDGAKILGVTQEFMFDELSKRRWIFKRSAHGKWMPYADKERRGFLKVCTDTVYDKEGQGTMYPQTRLTVKGLARLSVIFAPYLKIQSTNPLEATHV